MKNKKIYCSICEIITEHKFKGEQKGIAGKTLNLYDCIKCKDTCGRWINNMGLRKEIESLPYDIPDNSDLAEMFRNNHPHLLNDSL